jgi:Tol biopolymer transport system component
MNANSLFRFQPEQPRTSSTGSLGSTSLFCTLTPLLTSLAWSATLFLGMAASQGWSAAANAIVFTQGYNATTKQDIYVQSLAPGSKPRCVSCTVDHDILPSFSPDGQWIAYTVSGNGHSDIYAQRYRGGGPILRISADGGTNSLWAPAGREVFYRRGNEMWTVSFNPAQTVPGKARRLFSGQYTASDSSWNRDMALSPDGKRFLMLKALPESPDSHRIQIVLNWFEELKRVAR